MEQCKKCKKEYVRLADKAMCGRCKFKASTIDKTVKQISKELSKTKVINVFDFFSGTQSVKKGLQELFGIKYWYKNKLKNGVVFYKGTASNGTIIQYIGFDIESSEDENTILDLTQDNIVEKITTITFGIKPDFIWASPVCNRLSLTTALIGGHNPYFKVDKENETITPWEVGASCEGRKSLTKIVGTEKAHKEALMTLKMFENTKAIINHYNVPFAIENPKHSLTKYIMKGYERNFTSYCMYGFAQQKHTCIYSNKVLDLKVCDRTHEHKLIHANEKNQKLGRKPIVRYADKAAVPPLLIQEIIKQLLEEVNNGN